MSRYRESGSRDAFSVSVPYQIKQCRLTLSGGQWVREYRTVPSSLDYSGYSDNRQSIGDEVGEYLRFNGCSHTKRHGYLISGLQANSYEPSPFPNMNWPYTTEWYTYGQSNPASVGLSSIDFQGWHSGQIIPDVAFASPDWAQIVDQVGQQLDGRMLTSQNLLVDLMQIAQTARMFTNPFNLRNFGKDARSLSLSKLVKRGASSYLEYKFGWENIYRSMAALEAVWREVRTHRTYLEESAGKFVSISARQEQTVSNPSGIVFGTIGNDGVVSLKPRITRVTRTAAFSLDIMRRPEAVAWSTFDHVIARLGARDLAVALWDLVPYSFVVDWFTHVNRFIGQRSRMFNTFDLRRVGYSYKTCWYGTVKFRSYCNGYGGSSLKEYDLNEQLVQTKYDRISGFPPSTSSVGLFGNLNKTQIAEGVALLVQRL